MRRWMTNMGKNEAEEHMANMRRWFKNQNYIAGPPMGTATYTSEQLENMGMVGIYELKLVIPNRTPSRRP